jgi:hypothetical protein
MCCAAVAVASMACCRPTAAGEAPTMGDELCMLPPVIKNDELL